jgi:hypothetical protein
MVFAQQTEKISRSAPADLIRAFAGTPISFLQIEERTRRLPDGNWSILIIKSRIYRDAIGRLRIEEVPATDGSHIIVLIDPVSGSKAILSADDKIAYHVLGPKAGESGFAHGVGGLGQALPAGEWKTCTEDLGQRMIDGISAHGTRVTMKLMGQPPMEAVREWWWSDELKSICLASFVGPDWKHTAKIERVTRQEPDASLFEIPPDYKIREIGPPTASQR